VLYTLCVAGSIQRSEPELREQILGLVSEYFHVAHHKRPFIPGASDIPVSGKVFDERELQLLVESALEFQLTSDRFAEAFQEKFSSVMGVRHAMLCNSGSSANLLAVSSLCSPRLGKRALAEGDEVITVAAGFPTTVNPIFQNRLTPVFIDVELGTYNTTPERVQDSIGPRTRAIVIAHTLGNPYRADEIRRIADSNDLFFIEDACDAVGATINGKPVGSFGDLATASFYPAHHITMGEGGCVLTNSGVFRQIVESIRDWGRDCWCAPGRDNTCGRRFDWQLGDLPHGYDHKYIYSHIGYNLKLTDMQAAIGLAQLEKLSRFVRERRSNFNELASYLREFEDYLLLPAEEADTEASWFGFPITIRNESQITRSELIGYLESKGIRTRLLFGGNLLRQPAYQGLKARVAGSLENTNLIASRTFWIGVFPGIDGDMLKFVAHSFKSFFGGRA